MKAAVRFDGASSGPVEQDCCFCFFLMESNGSVNVQGCWEYLETLENVGTENFTVI